MKAKSIKAITLSMPFSHGGKTVIFHGKEWKSLEFNLVKIETDKGITGWGEASPQPVIPLSVSIFTKLNSKLFHSFP